MDRQPFVAESGHKYNGGRLALVPWFSTAQGRYVLEFELGQFDLATE